MAQEPKFFFKKDGTKQYYRLQNNKRRRLGDLATCIICGAEYVKPYYRPEQKACSDLCSIALKVSKKDQILRNCLTCGKELHRPKARATKYKVSFCSHKCQSEAQKIESINYKQDSGSKGSRRICLRYYPDQKCSECDYSERPALVEAHHIDGDRNNNTKENLIWFCAFHHRAITLGEAHVENRIFVWNPVKPSYLYA